jgi:hypothetical protein
MIAQADSSKRFENFPQELPLREIRAYVSMDFPTQNERYISTDIEGWQKAFDKVKTFRRMTESLRKTRDILILSQTMKADSNYLSIRRIYPTLPDSTLSRIPPPRSVYERLSLLSHEADEVKDKLEFRKFHEAYVRLDSLNDSIETIIMSGEIEEEIRDDLDLLRDSLESSKQIIYNGIRDGDVSAKIDRFEIIDFLEGAKNALKSFATLKEESTEES